MRKLLFIFCFLLASSSYSQTLKWVNFIAFEFEGDTCHLGDSALVTIKYTNNMVGEDTLVFSLQHVYPDNTVSGLTDVCRIGFIPFIHNLPLDANGNKSFKIKLPSNHDLGKTRILITSKPTQALKRPEFTLEAAPVSGIVDYFENESSTILYFDILGNKVKKPTSGLFIWIDNKGKSGKVFIE